MMTIIEMAILVTFAFLPPLLYTVWIRNTERYHRERWVPIFICFLWGATIAVIASIVLELLIGESLAITLKNASLYGLLATIIIAPFVEEFTKPIALNLKTVRRELDEIEDGYIYGAVAGLGFSATENLLYGTTFLVHGLGFFLLLMMMRSVGGCLLHASATAFTGYGFGKAIMEKSSLWTVLPFFILAFFTHAAYNLLATIGTVGIAIGLFLALFFVIFTISYIRKRIKLFDLMPENKK